MMGKQSEPQPALFHYGMNLEERVRKNHPLRQVAALIDFDFAYSEVEKFYGAVGHQSTPPPIILKLLFLLTYYNVRSERELLETVPERLDWLWFLGWEVDAKVPDHSVLSKARARWGAEVFRKLFEQVVSQCLRAGIIDGKKVHCDSSLVNADASPEAVERAICIEVTEELEQRLSEHGEQDEADEVEPSGRAQSYSVTDPDAAVVGRRGRDRARPRYKMHRAVDDLHGVITATTVTSGDVNEGRLLGELIDQHESSTGTSLETVVADSTYGTNENLLACNDRGIAPHLAPLKEKNNAAAQRERGVFTRAAFRYEPATDTYRCPAGASLKRGGKTPDRWGADRVSRVCRGMQGLPAQGQMHQSGSTNPPPARSTGRARANRTTGALAAKARSTASQDTDGRIIRSSGSVRLSTCPLPRTRTSDDPAAVDRHGAEHPDPVSLWAALPGRGAEGRVRSTHLHEQRHSIRRFERSLGSLCRRTSRCNQKTSSSRTDR